MPAQLRIAWTYACIVSLAGACAASKPAPAAGGELHWQAPLDRDHPLVGRIYDVARGEFVGEQALIERLRPAHFAAIGEQHDNPDHHLLQARLLRALVASGRRPTVVFEMLDRSAQPLVDRARAEHGKDADAFGAAVDWEHSGWPAFALYRPLFDAVLGASLPIAAGGIDRKAAMRIAEQGAATFEPDLAREVAAEQPLPPEQQAALREEMREAHCGMLPESMLDGMALIQRARDAQLALAMRAAGGQGALLIAGAGHVRSDRGVPAYLARDGAGATLAIGLVEVRAEWQAPAQYAADFASAQLPFDFVWFTPRASDVDHCAELRARPAASS